MLSNNGIATTGTNAYSGTIKGIQLNKAGIYKITCSISLDYIATGEKSNPTVYYNFGTDFFNDTSTSNITGLLGGNGYYSENTSYLGSATYDPIGGYGDISGNVFVYNINDPGILNWQMLQWNTQNVTTNLLNNQNHYIAGYITYNTGSNGAGAFGINCFEMTLTTKTPPLLFFNVMANNVDNWYNVNCYFTIQLLSTDCFQNYFSPPP